MGLPLTAYGWEAIYLFTKRIYTQYYRVYARHNREKNERLKSLALASVCFLKHINHNK